MRFHGRAKVGTNSAGRVRPAECARWEGNYRANRGALRIVGASSLTNAPCGNIAKRASAMSGDKLR
ncbi:hypothetical protein PT2222_70293 [Paraburkholderia tropica]